VLVAVIAGSIWRGVTLEDLHARREVFTSYIAAHPILSIEIYIVAYFLLASLSLPGALIMSLAAGYLFGVATGVAAAMTALMLASVTAYGVARWIMGDALRARIISGRGLVSRLQAGVDDNAFLTLLTLRLIPGLPFSLVNVAAAAVRIRFPTYVAATAVGILPSTLIYVSIGHALTSALNRSGVPKLSKVVQPEMMLPLAGLLVLSATPLAWKAWRARQGRLAGSDGAA
jgi:uncharacterized membrane protein YdjX (TVP38/TMEM64 family)